MLEANKGFLFEKIFAVYNRNLLKRRFDSLQVSGLELLQNKTQSQPLIIYANHSSWWDGLIAFQLSHQSDLDSFIMMEERQLINLPLFRKLGAFSVVRENPREALKSIGYAVDLLRRSPKRALWIFPQGEIKPNDVRPLRFYNGLARMILSFNKCSVIALALRYEFLGAYKPNIFVKIKKIELLPEFLNLKPKVLSDKLAEQLTGNLDQLKFDITRGNFSDYKKLIN